MEKFIDLVEKFFTSFLFDSLIPNLLSIIIIFIIGKILSKIARMLIKKLFSRKNSAMTDRKARTLSSITQSLVRYVIDFIVIYSILSIFIDNTSILAVVSVFSVAIGLGAQNFVKDIINGFLILLEDQYGVGDYIEISGKTGIVETLGLRTTNIRNSEGTLHVIPNSEIKIVSNLNKNFSRVVVRTTPVSGVTDEELIAIIKDELDSKTDNKVLQNLLNGPIVLGAAKQSTKNAITVKIIADCEIGQKILVEKTISNIIMNRLKKDKIQLEKDV